MNKFVYIDLVWAKQLPNTFKQRSNYIHKIHVYLTCWSFAETKSIPSIHMDPYTLLSDMTPTLVERAAMSYQTIAFAFVEVAQIPKSPVAMTFSL